MEDLKNFVQARDNEMKPEFLGQTHTVYRDFKAERFPPRERSPESEGGVMLLAMWRDPGLPRSRNLIDKSGDEISVQKVSGEDYFGNDNIAREYAPLRDEPGLFLRFAGLAENLPRTENNELTFEWIEGSGKEIALDWIKSYGVIGQSRTHQNLRVFWHEVGTAEKTLLRYKAATSLSGKDLRSLWSKRKDAKSLRKRARLDFQKTLNSKLSNECYPVQHFFLSEEEKIYGTEMSWKFRSLLGAMYLQLAWRISSRTCEAPRCNNIIPSNRRSDKRTCSKNCKERRRVS